MSDSKRQIFTVTELTRNIKQVLEGAFQSLWVEGEVSNFILHSSGHMYFSLKDASSVIQAVFFKGSNKDLKFAIKDGIKIICRGRISVYDKRGQYQIYVESAEPKGIGALQLAFEQLKEKLLKEGLFEASRKKPIPFLPRTIGIVTSPTGAAIRDMINILNRRFPGVGIMICPVKVQGEGAKEEIAEAIRVFNRLKNVDVIIVGRGGGSMEDLWAFNEEMVARAVAASGIPIISAVGHEIDWTICDFVADMRAPTPSAAAELIVPRQDELVLRINDSIERLKNGLSNLALQYEQNIDDLLQDLIEGEKRFVSRKEEFFLSLIGKLEALSPLAVLGRGYSITEKVEDGKVAKDSKDLKRNDLIKTILSKGRVVSRVEEIM